MLEVFEREGRGFTLIEMLVVIAVISLLASIVLISVNSVRAQARDAIRQANLDQINLAMEICYNDENCDGVESYPDTGTCGTPPCPDEVAQIDTDGDPLYFIVPDDPSNSGDQRYTWTNGSNQYYCVYTKSESKTNTWFCASNKGVREQTYSGPPTKDDCCGMDTDD